VPNYIGECLLKIATHISYKPNWVNYSYKEDMISDGIENSIQYIMSFNPDRSSNPFSYFTSVIENAFKRRKLKETRQMDIKERILEQAGFDEVFFDDDSGNGNSSDYNSIKDSIYSRGRL
jgi:DNA-directed RNA polymerase specialized sigma24 family protein